ncbi:PTS sorbitol transporter subunit IIA [Lactobacillus sp. PV037]|uniref:PTS glucitol/sorbitol transporter subunit IIA n=1 Tax=unclassified Lactobacillus TaxID=2620435 RepID=UPI00223FF3F8|nr:MULTISPECIES: PTS glucitol/sorbitol transporter subunit IIA [unclassified Lactobacillus]QNQ82582.1 PTS sorbitol transporter subunit IIA [Lactobacillus sp. PV012]QNQ83303.1 PTS sorbitol transporter subunit IIA [Lactobacillus sp. PV037]
MKWTSTIQEIGPEAVSENENVVILFNETATPHLKQVSVIQKFDQDTPVNSFILKKDDTITINGETYLALFVGSLVKINMRSMGHATLIFTDELPQEPMKNAIYLEKAEEEPIAQFAVGDEIVFEHR